ncbi:MAG: hypothetical protein OYL41_04460 [Acidobacteriota bacterium]|nr:hypothetical protein [Acidobacteriota bacterium]
MVLIPVKSAVRDEVWAQMVQTDRLQRYYGELVNQQVRLNRVMAGVTTAFAMVTLALIQLSSDYAWAFALGTIAGSIVPFVYRSDSKISRALECRRELGYSYEQLRSLWLTIEINEGQNAEILKQLQELTTRVDNATSKMPEVGAGHPLLRWRTERSA